MKKLMRVVFFYIYIYIDTSDSHIPYESNMHDFILCSHCILNCALFRANYLVFFSFNDTIIMIRHYNYSENKNKDKTKGNMNTPCLLCW